MSAYTKSATYLLELLKDPTGAYGIVVSFEDNCIVPPPFTDEAETIVCMIRSMAHQLIKSIKFKDFVKREGEGSLYAAAQIQDSFYLILSVFPNGIIEAHIVPLELEMGKSHILLLHETFVNKMKAYKKEYSPKPEESVREPEAEHTCCICLEENLPIGWSCRTCKDGIVCKKCRKAHNPTKKGCPVCRT